MKDVWHVYIIECKNKKLYVGIAKNVKKRIREHNKGTACRFTKYRHPVKLLYAERCLDYSSARKQEKELKGYRKDKKLKVIFKEPLTSYTNV